MLYPKILAEVYNRPVMIRLEKLAAIRRVVTDRALGVHVDGEMIEIIKAQAARDRAPTVARSVAVLPVLGTLAKRMDLFEESSGGTSTDRLAREFDRLMADDTVGAIVLDIDSPGGQVFGTEELADKIFAARGTKPLVAVANAEAASAAYYIASATDEVSITPSGEVGSVGVFLLHADWSKWNEEQGIAPTYIFAGRYKVEGNPDEPLAPETVAHYQAEVDGVYDAMVRAVARNRGLTPAAVRKDFGQGRMLRAAEAKAAGMVDRIETLDEAVARLAGNKKAARGARAEIERRRLALREREEG
jgi:signal peptide peptidase SppA